MDPRIATLLAEPRWHDERVALRAILLDSPLTEAVKWDQLCYTCEGANVAIFFGLKTYCGIGFFKGSLLRDEARILHRQGEHSQAMRLIRFADVAEVAAMEPAVRAYVAEAIGIEKAGLKVDFKEKDALVFPEELIARLAADAALKAAFETLTPGRQRAYNLHFTGAKQSATRAARIEACMARILAGKGLADR